MCLFSLFFHPFCRHGSFLHSVFSCAKLLAMALRSFIRVLVAQGRSEWRLHAQGPSNPPPPHTPCVCCKDWWMLWSDEEYESNASRATKEECVQCHRCIVTCTLTVYTFCGCSYYSLRVPAFSSIRAVKQHLQHWFGTTLIVSQCTIENKFANLRGYKRVRLQVRGWKNFCCGMAQLPENCLHFAVLCYSLKCIVHFTTKIFSIPPPCASTALSKHGSPSDRCFPGCFWPRLLWSEMQRDTVVLHCIAEEKGAGSCLWYSLLLIAIFCLQLQPSAVCVDMIFSHG